MVQFYSAMLFYTFLVMFSAYKLYKSYKHSHKKITNSKSKCINNPLKIISLKLKKQKG